MLYKYSDLQEGFSEEIHLNGQQEFTHFGFMFGDGIISKITIQVHDFDGRRSVHIILYAGNIRIGTTVTYSDFVTEYNKLGEDKDHYFYIREAHEWDYR